jgi:hypothetical protein
MTPSKVSLDSIRELAAKLSGLSARPRAVVKREFAEVWGISSSSLSRALNEVGVRCHSRADVGGRRKAVEEKELCVIAALQRMSLSLRKGVVMPAVEAIRVAVDSGIVEPGLVDPSYYNEWARGREASRRAQAKPEPHIELRSLGPNHVHQVDFSLAVNWKMFDGKFQYEHLIYKNKLPSAGVQRLLRLILVDHTTGSLFAHYTCTTGETVQALLAGLYHAWAEKRIAGDSVQRVFPFRGVPQILMADRGSANQAGITATLMERLAVKLNICEGARSKGSVEVAHGIWESRFESKFRLHPPVSVEQLNDWAVDFAAKYNAEAVHTRHGATRTAMWAWHIGRLPETQLRELKTDFETFKGIALSEPALCVVNGARIIRFKTQKYRVPEEFSTGERVAVQYSPFRFPEVIVRHNCAGAAGFLCEPIEVDEFGFAKGAAVIGVEYKSQKKSETARFVGEAETTGKALVEGGGLRVYGHHAATVEETRIRHTGTDVLASGLAGGSACPTYMTRVAARREVVERIGRGFTAPEAAWVARSFGEQVTEEEIAAAVAAISGGIRGEVMEMGGR